MSDERRAWIPRTGRERLIYIDTVLADIVPRIDQARARITDIIPGHSGRPAGTGEPAGGSSYSSTSVVERTAATLDRDLAALARLDQLVDDTQNTVTHLILDANGFRLPPPAPHISRGARLAWCRVIIRVLIEAHVHPRHRKAETLWKSVTELEALVDTWAAPRTVARRSADLAVDDTDTNCRSHLRIGHRVPRTHHYAKDGLCRTCGDIRAEHGFLPTLEILDALVAGKHGSTIAKLIRDAQPKAKKKRRRR